MDPTTDQDQAVAAWMEGLGCKWYPHISAWSPTKPDHSWWITPSQALFFYIICQRAERKGRRALVNDLQSQIARYGDGEIVRHNGEAVVPISAVLAQLKEAHGN